MNKTPKTERRCSHCCTVKSVDEFYKSARSWCKECHRERARAQVASGYFRARWRTLPKVGTCITCRRKLPLDAFRPSARTRSKRCKECIASIMEAARIERQNRKATAQALKPPRDEIGRLCKVMFDQCHKRSVVVGRHFDLTLEQVIALVREFCANNYHSLKAGDPFRPSIDRIISGAGYTASNIRIVWVIENLAKNRFSEEKVIEFCKRKLGIPVDGQPD